MVDACLRCSTWKDVLGFHLTSNVQAVSAVNLSKEKGRRGKGGHNDSGGVDHEHSGEAQAY